MDYTYRHSDRIYTGSNNIPNAPGVESIFHRITVNGAVRLRDNLVLNASLPFTDATRLETGLADRSISGAGDLALSAVLSPFTAKDSKLKNWKFNAGIVFPTGDAADQPLTGNAAPSVLQLGTGAYQLTLGSSYSWGEQNWNYQVSFKAQLPLNESSQGFEPAAMYFASFTASRSISETVSVNFGVDFTESKNDKFQGADLITGYSLIALKAGVVWNITEDLSLSGVVRVPVYRDVNETQLATGTMLQLGVSRSF